MASELRWYHVRCPIRIRFSLREMLLLVALLGTGLGWLGMQLGRERDRLGVQRLAVEALESAGATVYFDFDVGEESPFLYWLRRVEGQEFGSHVIRVSNRGPGEIPAHVAVFDRLRPQEFRDLSDAHLLHLRFLRGLESLDLSENDQFTDASLARLEGLIDLRELKLLNTGVEGFGLTHLRENGRPEQAQRRSGMSPGMLAILALTCSLPERRCACSGLRLRLEERNSWDEDNCQRKQLDANREADTGHGSAGPSS
jgi:hypothetical protein